VAGAAISAGYREIVILTLYVSPAMRITMEVWDELTRYITPTTIVCGDFNAHHFSWDPGSQVDRHGQQVFNWAEDASYCSLMMVPLQDWETITRGIQGWTSLS